MIEILDVKDCCGCAACVQKCPKRCIELYEDQEGFLYPKINQDNCIDCGICENVCPELNQSKQVLPQQVYAAKNKNEEIRSLSSSGGIFTLLSEAVLSENGIVFGAKFDSNWEVVHGYTDHIEGLSDFRGSKYVQSRIGDSYKQAELFLRAGRKVLFSGTPCQVAGLKLFLKKEYENLLCVDFVCHGVPSPKVWRKYLHELSMHQEQKKESCLYVLGASSVSSVKFRDKRLGWKKFSLTIGFSSRSLSNGSERYISEPLDKNIFMKGFLFNLYLRPSCHACPAKAGKSRSDITIGDYWGIQKVSPQLDDDKGISLVMIASDKGKSYYLHLATDSLETSYVDALKGNSAIEKSPSVSQKRTLFFASMDNVLLYPLITKLTHVSFPIIMRRRLMVLLRKVTLAFFTKFRTAQ